MAKLNEKKKNRNHGPTLAPGMNDREELEQDANQNDIEKGEFTRVTTFSFDEVDPS